MRDTPVHTIHSALSVAELRIKLAGVIKSAPSDSNFQTQAPVVHDRLLGRISDKAFECYIYRGQVTPGTLIASGDFSPSNKGCQVDITFSRTKNFTLYLMIIPLFLACIVFSKNPQTGLLIALAMSIALLSVKNAHSHLQKQTILDLLDIS